MSSSKGNNINIENIGGRIKVERIALGLTQADLAEKLRMSRESRQTIINWENGKTLPSLDILLDMCKLFNCEMGYLLGEEGYEGKTRAMTDIQKLTGLSKKVIKRLQIFNNSNSKFNEYLNYKAIEPINAIEYINTLLEHAELGEFIEYTHFAKKYSVLKIPEDAIGKDVLNTEETAGKIGYGALEPKKMFKFHRQEALNALHNIVYDIIPDKKEKEEDHGNSNKERR